MAGDPPSPWEESVGFSRLVRAGPLLLVGGTTSIDPTGVVIGETLFEQTVEVLRKIEHELGRAGASPRGLIQARVYLTDISRAEDVGRAWVENLSEVRPTMTMVQVSSLIDPRMLVEIEAVAFVG